VPINTADELPLFDAAKAIMRQPDATSGVAPTGAG
jgi:hypothetical protein